MQPEGEDRRWQALMDIQDDLGPVRAHPSSADQEPRRRARSRKAAQFGDALSGLGDWSAVPGAEKRRLN